MAHAGPLYPTGQDELTEAPLAIASIAICTCEGVAVEVGGAGVAIALLLCVTTAETEKDDVGDEAGDDVIDGGRLLADKEEDTNELALPVGDVEIEGKTESVADGVRLVDEDTVAAGVAEMVGALVPVDVTEDELVAE